MRQVRAVDIVQIATKIVKGASDGNLTSGRNGYIRSASRKDYLTPPVAFVDFSAGGV